MIGIVVRTTAGNIRQALHWKRVAVPGWQYPLFVAMALPLSAPAPAASHDIFRVTVVDAKTGRGVPLAELTTTSTVTYVADSAGVVAFNDPRLPFRRIPRLDLASLVCYISIMKLRRAITILVKATA